MILLKACQQGRRESRARKRPAVRQRDANHLITVNLALHCHQTDVGAPCSCRLSARICANSLSKAQRAPLVMSNPNYNALQSSGSNAPPPRRYDGSDGGSKYETTHGGHYGRCNECALLYCASADFATQVPAPLYVQGCSRDEPSTPTDMVCRLQHEVTRLHQRHSLDNGQT